MHKPLIIGAAVAGGLLLGPTTSAEAALIAAFSQNFSATPTVTATDNGTTTNILVNSQSTTITTGASGTIPNALFSLNATSTTAALSLGSQVIQRYSGSFCFTSAAACGGTNYISGVFTDAAFGALGGAGLTVNVNNPPDSLTLTSDVVPASSLIPPSSFNLGFADLTPLLNINGTTIGAFTANFAGDISANATTAAEPATIAILGMGVLGLAAVSRRRRDPISRSDFA